MRSRWFCALVSGLIAAGFPGVLPGGHAQDGAENEDRATVFVLPLRDQIDEGLMMLFRRAFKTIEEVSPDAVLIDIDTPGGGLLQTEEIIAWMRSTDVPIYAYVNTHAQSAGAIVSLGSDGIYMAPGSRIGSALPIIMTGGGVAELPENVYEKLLSDTRALVRGVAEENGHDPELAMAMVDPAVEFKVGDRVVCAEGELLNLTAKEATEVIPPRTEPLLALAEVEDIDGLLAHAGYANPELVRFEPEPAEDIARWIIRIGPILFALGIIGIYIEIKTPGFGVPGLAGIVCLMIFFFGHHVAGLAGIEDMFLVLLGLVLIAVEVFVIPGFGVAGVLGILSLVSGLLLAFVPHIPDIPDKMPGVDTPGLIDFLPAASARFVVTVIAAGIGIYILAKLLPKTSMYGKLVLQTALTSDTGYISSNAAYSELLGKQGVAQTGLRPSGIATIEGQRADVVTSGDMIAKGTPIRVVDVEGARIVVEPVDEDSAD